jgi:imidazolonepropionase-like amidohydrolase
MNAKTAALILFLAAIDGPAAAPASEQVPAPPQAHPVALVGGTLYPVSGPPIENGTILFDRGRIVDLGKDIPLPADAIRVDIAGKRVYPSLIESSSHLGLVEIDADAPTRDFAEVGEVNPNVRAETAINPDSERLPVTRANGVGLAVSLPAGGLISGMAALIKLDGWTWEEMTLRAPLALVVNWPDMGGYAGLVPAKVLEQRRKNIDQAIETLEKAFRDARAYREAREAAGARGVPFHATDVRWEAMLPVLRGEVPVWINADRLQEIEAAVEFADRQKVRLVLVGGADSWRAADLLKKKDVPVIVTPVLRLPLRLDTACDEPFSLPERLRQAGVRFCIAGGSGSGNERNLPYHAAMAAAYGLPREEALKAVTLYAAQILGVADRMGTLDKGKEASLIVTDGDPLEITTRVEKLYLQGREVDLGNRQKTLYAKYREKYRQQDRTGGNK